MYFPDAGKWEGKKLRVTGVIQLYREKPEIILNAAGQVEVLK
jgi:DNA/RNA endonuclease YhcR with UshA esterase domain